MLQALGTLQRCKNTRQNGGVSTKRSAYKSREAKASIPFRKATRLSHASMQPSVPQKIERNGDSVNGLREYLFHVNVSSIWCSAFLLGKAGARAERLVSYKDFQS